MNNATQTKPHIPKTQPSVSLIIPTYQAEAFIVQNLNQLETYAKNTPHIQEIILIDDGSKDQTPALVREYVTTQTNTCITLIALEQNEGKGAAIKKGIKKASGNFLIFTDCDLPYAFSDIDNLIQSLANNQADVIIGSRMHPQSVYHIRSHNLSYIYIRHTSGRLFNYMINFYTRLGFNDTQAGLKGFTQEAAHLCFDKMTVSGFAFDIDLLVCAQQNNLRIEAVPLNFNYDSEMSTVSFLKHAMLMKLSVLHIFFKKITRYYTRS